MSDHTLRLSTGRTLGYAEYGDPTGQPFFYFHGWPSSRLQGELVDEIGKKRGLRVIAPDRPGIGLSDFQPERRILDWPPVLVELAAHLQWEKFHIFGVSGGGPYVLATASAMPERVLRAGVCCGATPLRILGTKELLWTYRLALWTRRCVPFLLGPGLRITGWIVRQDPSVWPLRMFIASLCKEDQRAIANPELHRILTDSCRESLRSPVTAIQQDGDLYSSDWGFDLGSISVPVRYWHGGQDSNIPLSYAQRTAQMLPKAITQWYPNDGHYSLPLLRTGELITQLLGN